MDAEPGQNMNCFVGVLVTIGIVFIAVIQTQIVRVISRVVEDLTATGPDIPALREQLVVLVSAGKAKDVIGEQLTHDQVKRVSDKDVEKYFKRYETHLG